MTKTKPLITLFLIVCLIFTGCSKNKNEEPKETLTELTPSVEPESEPTNEVPKDEESKEEKPPKTNSAALSSLNYTEAMNPGWNLGNTFDAVGNSGETSWGNPVVTKELIHAIKEAGFNSIRLPLTLDGRMEGFPNYTINNDYLERYAEVVNWALEEDLYVMINIHHDSWLWVYNIETDDGSTMERYKAIWTQLSDYFKDYPEQVCFESINEPYFNGEDKEQIKILETVNTEFVHLVRNSGGLNDIRKLVLPTLVTNDSQEYCTSLLDTMNGLEDENLIATCHYYGFWPFSVNIAGCTTMTDEVTQSLRESFDRMNETFVKNGYGVICGEYGLLGFDSSLDTIEPGEVLKYFEYINYYSKETNIPLMLWDNGQHFNRNALEWSNDTLYQMMKASWTSRSSYTESDRIFITEETKNNDYTYNLYLNGNTLVEITDGDMLLVEGEDFTLDGEQITFKNSYLSSIIRDEVGISKELTMKFSAGADWTVQIIKYEMPVITGGEGSTKGFDIFVDFNGSYLSTLEAVNTEGKGVGPQNWTTFKEHTYTYSPKYDQNLVTIRENFFAETQDEEILFKLHFQGGEILELRIEKSGENVTIK